MSASQGLLIGHYRALCSVLYQAAGARDLPERFLDALSAGADGRPPAPEAARHLLPCEARSTLPTGRESQRRVEHQQKAESLRRFPANTCPASRHVQLIAEKQTDDEEASSLFSVLASLWTLRGAEKPEYGTDADIIADMLNAYADALADGELDGAGRHFPEDIREMAERLVS